MMVTYDARPSAFTQLSTTADWESFLSSCGITDGVDGPASFVPSLDTGGRNAVISAGQSVVKGQLWRADAPVSTPIPGASAQNRLDRLVIRLNRGATSSPAVVAPTIITGAPSGSPVLPPITQTPTGIYDIPISNWLSTSAGGLTTLVDQRQFSGRSVVMMTSAYHPTPVSPCMGFETDTGNFYYWNGTTWLYVSPNIVRATPVPQLINTTAAQSVNNCTLPVTPGSWEIVVQAIYTGNQAAGGASFQIASSATISYQWGIGLISNSAAASQRLTANQTGMVFTSPAMTTDAWVVQLNCFATFTTAGVITLQAFCGIAADTYNIQTAMLKSTPS
jgi:hypothetical protein